LEIAKNPDCEDDIIQLVDDLLTVLRRGAPKDDYLSPRGREALAIRSGNILLPWRECQRARIGDKDETIMPTFQNPPFLTQPLP